jgi:UDP-N-acetylmuramoyl-tripeptide--D-alanyl-D-alanine ligase
LQLTEGLRDLDAVNSKHLSWTTRDILEATGGKLLCGNPDERFERISIDSRTLSAADAFVAIVGRVHDGHRFAGEVAARGVRGLVVASDRRESLPLAEWEKRSLSCIAVADTTIALGRLGAFHRERAGVSVVAITGSNGKTTTRRMAAAVVSGRYRTLATMGNYNNEIGVPLTLLRLEADHQWAVMELGTNHPGEIAALADICRPDVGVITNIGPAHLEGLGSLEGVLRAKWELIEKLNPGGRAVLNADDPRLMRLARECPHPVLLFGESEAAAVRAAKVEERPGGVRFELVLPDQTLNVDLPVSGRFMVSNALAAAAVGCHLQVPAAAIQAGLEAFEPVQGRLTVFHTAGGIHLIDDTYNANPASMRAAVSTLTAVCKNERSILVAGDMLELGDQAPELHRDVGRFAAASGVRRLYAVGDLAAEVRKGAVDGGMDSAAVMIGSRDEIIEALKRQLVRGDWVLVKGSRSMAMERVVQALKTRFG